MGEFLRVRCLEDLLLSSDEACASQVAYSSASSSTQPRHCREFFVHGLAWAVFTSYPSCQLIRASGSLPSTWYLIVLCDTQVARTIIIALDFSPLDFGIFWRD